MKRVALIAAERIAFDKNDGRMLLLSPVEPKERPCLRPSLGFVCLLGVIVSATPTTAQHSAIFDQVAQATCTETLIVISGPRESDRNFACSGARQAVELLGRCGVSLKRPIRIEIADQINHPFARSVLGFFDATEEKVLVRSSQNVGTIVDNCPHTTAVMWKRARETWRPERRWADNAKRVATAQTARLSNAKRAVYGGLDEFCRRLLRSAHSGHFGRVACE